MSNRDRAADVIRAHGFDPCRVPECIAQDLADAGLLAPDLPEPQEHGGKLIWPLQDRDGFVTAIGGSVFLNDERGPVLTVDKNVARELGHIFLAATNQEGSQE